VLLSPEQDQTDVVGAIQSLQKAVDDGPTEGAADPNVERARDLLTLLHRTWLRPRNGQPIWLSGRMLEGVTLRKPRGVAGGPGGLVVASDAAAAVVVGGDGKVAATQVLRDGARPTVGADGTALIASSGEVQEYPSRKTETFAFLREKLQDLDKLVSVARGPFGEWLVLDRGIGAVAVLSREERSLRELPASRSEVVDFAVGPLGRIYVLTSREPRVLVYGPDFQQIQTITGSWQRPQAIDVDALGNVYVLDRAARTIEVRDRTGASVATVGPTLPGGVALRNVEDIGVDARGRLLVVDEDVPGVVVLE
jgi:DNA-binding beta-propeller fold protein YncE